MRMRWVRAVGLFLLCVYAAAIAHEVFPHHRGDGDGDSCSLCLLLTSVVVVVCGVALVLGQRPMALAFIPHVAPFSRSVREPFSLRGPPSLPF